MQFSRVARDALRHHRSIRPVRNFFSRPLPIASAQPPIPASCSSARRANSSGSAAGSGSVHQVATYNILCDSLAEPSWFTDCDPLHLDASTRLHRIKSRLQEQIDAGAIICLQEVSHTWAGELHSFLSSQGYYLITAHYGRKFNGYMGTALCFPLHKYELLDTGICRVSDGLEWKQLEPIPESHLGGPEDLGPVQSMQNMGMVERKENVQLSIRLRERNDSLDCSTDGSLVADYSLTQTSPEAKASHIASDEFCVSTYHMPCAFRFPHVMTCHAALSVQAAATFAGKDTPFVLAGDFNFDPSSSSYALVTSGEATPEQRGHMRVRREKGESAGFHSNIESKDKDEGIFEFAPRLQPLTSAYAVRNGTEPEVTNYATVQGSEPFIACLDYIFLSPGNWTVHDTRPLPSREEMVTASKSLPSESEPSDHVLISAALELNRSPSEE